MVLYGFGWIGCLFVCLLIEKSGVGYLLCLWVIVVCGGKEGDFEKCVSLFCWDLVYG